MSWWPWKKRQVPEQHPSDEELGDARRAKESAETTLREVLDQQPRVWRAVDKSMRYRRVNHFAEDLERAIRRIST